jgi:hypothetical protein
MPTIYRFDGFRFFFYSNEGSEPAHIHVSKGDGECKIWLIDLEMEYCHIFTVSEKKIIVKIVRNNRDKFLNEWVKFYE